MSLLFGRDFFAAVGRLTPREQAACTEFVLRFHDNPANPGISLERVSAADRGLWSARWAERRQATRHPVTGALQIVEAVTSQAAADVSAPVASPSSVPGLFAAHPDAYLLSLGVPDTWLPALRQVRTDDHLLDVASRLPDDVADRLLRLAAGELVTPPAPVSASRPVVAAAAASSAFVTVTDGGDLAIALRQPLDRWIAFLHPSQRAIVDLAPRGPVKVTGSAGTGKTVVALHRARALARRGLRVLLTSFTTTLSDNLERGLRKLCTADELALITVSTVHKQALALVRRLDRGVQIADEVEVPRLVDHLAAIHAPAVDVAFLRAEWESVVDRQGLTSWPEYRAAQRTGRGRALSVTERRALWNVFGGVLDGLAARRRATWTMLCRQAEAGLAAGGLTSPFDAVVVDEVQDLRPAELRLLRALTAAHPEHLMLCGDASQRIYPGGFTLGALGIDVRGRSHVLRLNYRTTAEICRAADHVLGAEEDDLDGATARRTPARSLLSGPEPTLEGFASRSEELTGAVTWIAARLADGLAPGDLAAFARSNRRVEELAAALRERGIAAAPLTDADSPADAVAVGTMHRAKGLECKAVLVLSASADSLPARGALQTAADPADRDAVLARERQLLYVAMTRARDLLRVTWAVSPSPFLAPLLESS